MMPVRLLKPYNGQAAGTSYFGSATEENSMRATNTADDQIELASDYWSNQRTVTTATANIVRTATYYVMASSSAQTLTLNQTGYWPNGTIVTVKQAGTGKTTLTPGTGITIVQGNGIATLLTGGQNYLGQLIKDSPTQWTAFGGFGG